MQRPAFPFPFSWEAAVAPKQPFVLSLRQLVQHYLSGWQKSSNFLGAVLAPVPASSLKSVLSVIKATSRSPVCLTLVSYFSTDSEEKKENWILKLGIVRAKLEWKRNRKRNKVKPENECWEKTSINAHCTQQHNCKSRCRGGVGGLPQAAFFARSRRLPGPLNMGIPSSRRKIIHHHN